MENNLLASALRDAAPTAGAVGAALYAYKVKDSLAWAIGAAFMGYLVTDYVRQKLFTILLDPPVDLPIVPAQLPASGGNGVTNPKPLPSTPGTIEVQDKNGNVISL